MTALDDALDSSSYVVYRPTVYVDWREAPPNYENNPDPGTVRSLGAQIGDSGYTIVQALDDGLPDAVTMTSQTDASGTLVADFTGRQAAIADVMGWRTDPMKGNGTGTSDTFSTSVPADATWGDYALVAVSINNNSNISDALGEDWVGTHSWKLIASYDDGATNKIWVFGSLWYEGMIGPTIKMSVPTAYSWIAAAVYAQTVNGTQVPIRVIDIKLSNVSIAATTHTLPAVKLNRRGWVVGIWSTISATNLWSAGSGTTEINEMSTGTMDVMISRSTAVQDPGDYVITATTSSSTANVAMIGLGVEIADITQRDAAAVWSPFNKQSPVYGWDRDTARLTFNANFLTDSGLLGRTIFTGQMSDMPVSGRSTELQGMSRVRMWLSRSVTLPTVWGTTEGCTIDWVSLYLLARGSQFHGPAPNKETVYWNPMSGSVHPFFAHENTYHYGWYYDSTGTYALTPMPIIDGPFHRAVYASQGTTYSYEINASIVPNKGTEILPHLEDAYRAGEMFNDQLSKLNSKGRITFWMRGDFIQSNPINYSWSVDTIFTYQLRMYDASNTIVTGLTCGITSATRVPYLDMGTSVAYSRFTPSDPNIIIPNDGEWHLVSYIYDYANATGAICVDGYIQSGSTFAQVVPANLPISAADNEAIGGRTYNQMRTHLPLSDLIVDAGPGCYDLTFADVWPIPAEPAQNIIYLSTDRPLATVVEPTPVNAWDILSQIARDSHVAYRVDEFDQMNWLPPKYFGQSEQMTPQTTALDTMVNAGEINVTIDPSKIRNVVTVQFPETRIDDKYSGVLVLSTSLKLRKGKSQMTFALDIPTAVIHGAQTQTTTWKMSKLTSSQITTPTTIPTNVHFVSVNSKSDGTGTVYSLDNDFTATIIEASVSTVTIEFNNKRNQTLYLANNGDQVPFMKVLGYAIRQSDAYVTVRNTDVSVARRERSLSVETHWIHDRSEATMYAVDLLSTLSLPRAEITVEVVGNPKRIPGQLVTIKDSENTQAEGTWRILSVTHNGAGAKYTQNVQLVNVPPVGNWDDVTTTWNYSVWGE